MGVKGQIRYIITSYRARKRSKAVMLPASSTAEMGFPEQLGVAVVTVVDVVVAAASAAVALANAVVVAAVEAAYVAAVVVKWVRKGQEMEQMLGQEQQLARTWATVHDVPPEIQFFKCQWSITLSV